MEHVTTYKVAELWSVYLSEADEALNSQVIGDYFWGVDSLLEVVPVEIGVVERDLGEKGFKKLMDWGFWIFLEGREDLKFDDNQQFEEVEGGDELIFGHRQ